MEWKKKPVIMKILIILLSISVFFKLIELFSSLTQPTNFFGFFISPPLSSIIFILTFVALVFFLVSLYIQKYRKPLLYLQGINILNTLTNSIVYLITPFTVLMTRYGLELPEGYEELVPNFELLTKVFSVFGILIGLTIGILIFVYIYKQKDYFNPKPKKPTKKTTTKKK